MKDDLARSVARTLDGGQEIMPYLPELLQDLWSLGSPPERCLGMIESLNLKRSKTRVLDLGCGKGAISITLAKEKGFRILGIDGCQEFIDFCREKVVELQVGSLCEFRVGDIRESVKSLRNFDLVVYASVGRVLGSPREAMEALRKCVRSGGYIFIDDGYAKSGARYYEYLPYDKTISQLLYYGDRLLKEVIHPDDELQEMDDEYLRLIKKRGRLMIKRRPGLKTIIQDYIDSQEKECEKLEKSFCNATWLFQRID